jgi:hypothetical protein
MVTAQHTAPGRRAATRAKRKLRLAPCASAAAPTGAGLRLVAAPQILVRLPALRL